MVSEVPFELLVLTRAATSWRNTARQGGGRLFTPTMTWCTGTQIPRGRSIHTITITPPELACFKAVHKTNYKSTCFPSVVCLELRAKKNVCA